MASLGLGGAQVISNASGGKVFVWNTINTAVQTVLPANPQRQRITFHNPGDVDIFVSPTIGWNGALISPNTAALGGCFRIFANGGTLIIDGECQFPWQAFSASGSGKPLTIMDSNVGPS